MISIELLLKYNAHLKEYKKNDFLFATNDTPRHYYQINDGEVKMYNMNKEGKECIHFIYSKNRSLGESALLGNFKYPASCIATQESKIWLLPKRQFFRLLNENKEILFEITENISKQLYFKTIISTEITIENSEHKILTLLDYLKEKIYHIESPYGYEVELSRQQIANLIGLRVETVIRAVKKLEKNRKIKLKNHKIHR